MPLSRCCNLPRVGSRQSLSETFFYPTAFSLFCRWITERMNDWLMLIVFAPELMSALDGQYNASEIANVVERILCHENQVRMLAGFNSADVLIQIHHSGCVDGCSPNRVGRRNGFNISESFKFINQGWEGIVGRRPEVSARR